MSSVALPRPTERVAILSLVLVFLCGAVVGAVVMGMSGHTGHLRKPTTSSFAMSADQWRQELNLSDTQTREMNSILDDFGRYYDNLIADGQTRVRQILNPQQRRKFDQMIENRGGR